MADSSIEWLRDPEGREGKTWNPLKCRLKLDAAEIAQRKGYASLLPILQELPPGKIGHHCEKISPGCVNCYACAMNARKFESWGTKLPYDRRSRDLLDFWLDEKELTAPLHWKKARRVFPASMTDAFGEWWPDGFIDGMFAVSALSHQHLYLYLTKRSDRLLVYLQSRAISVNYWESAARKIGYTLEFNGLDGNEYSTCPFPLPNVLIGFSAENQEEFDSRWPHMHELAKAGWKVWCSLEPMIGPVDITAAAKTGLLRWVVPGGESGHGARPFDIWWPKQVIRQCEEYGVPCFVKQLGAKPMYRSHGNDDPRHLFNGLQPLFSNGKPLRNKKGSDPAEWPWELRVRQYA